MNKYLVIAIGLAALLTLVGVIAIFFKYVSLGNPSIPALPVPPPVTVATTTDGNGDKTFVDLQSGTSFQYPERLLPEYISAPIWPPKIRVATGTLTCIESLTDRGESTASHTVGGRQYCVTTESEGAAGSVYSTYTYQTEMDGKIISAMFTLRAVECSNYDEPKRTACGEEREVFDIDSTIDRIVQSVTYPQ